MNADTQRMQTLFQQLLEECTIGTSIQLKYVINVDVSVVVRRMYYWDRSLILSLRCSQGFSSCQKNVLLGHQYAEDCYVLLLFQQLLEECTIGTARAAEHQLEAVDSFSSCQKNVLLGQIGQDEAGMTAICFSSCQKNVLLGLLTRFQNKVRSRFSSCQKNVLLGLQTQPVENKGF